ncbi:DUF1292 domain-containing protein [Marinisporobacter balticus]|uniref:Uncharacterized protein DUF1292 n=1 Tax=Marinisporobacter balticus TaxID=2018667 RepID=A0A4R2KTV9_9FIRM|nr:DUF1292 domain-containing protein [Marinisporobacter balticus]TCO74529.1 uncharacterized protein DUF1292 [Marinisporobacter balticus]
MEDKKIVTFADEEGKKNDFEVVDVLNIEEDKYALLAPVGEEDDAYVYKIIEVDGKEEYIPIEDDDEFARVSEEYESYFGEE